MLPIPVYIKQREIVRSVIWLQVFSPLSLAPGTLHTGEVIMNHSDIQTSCDAKMRVLNRIPCVVISKNIAPYTYILRTVIKFFEFTIDLRMNNVPCWWQNWGFCTSPGVCNASRRVPEKEYVLSTKYYARLRDEKVCLNVMSNILYHERLLADTAFEWFIIIQIKHQIQGGNTQWESRDTYHRNPSWNLYL